MFAYSCAKVNGTHLGTCIDRFYFGSCCKTQSNTDIEINEPDNFLTNIDNDVVGPPVTTNIKINTQQTSTDRYSSQSNSQATQTNYPSSTLLSYKPTTQFAVSSTPSTTSTSRNQYTEVSITNSFSNGTKPTFSSNSPSSISSPYSTTTSQSTKPMVSTTFSTVKPMVKPSSHKPLPIRDPVISTQKPKPQTIKPTVQFSVPSSTSSNIPYSTNQETTKPVATSTYTSVTSMRPLNSNNVTATFSTIKPVVKPSSTTYKSTSTSSTTVSPQKVKPQTAKPQSTAKPKPSSAKPDPTSTIESITGSYTTRSTIENVTAIISNFTAATTVMNTPSQTTTYGSTTVTSTSPTLVTWTTLDKVPAVPSDQTKPSSGKFLF